MTKQITNIGKLFIIFLLLLFITKACNAQTVDSFRTWTQLLDSAEKYDNLAHCAKSCAPDSVYFYKDRRKVYFSLMKKEYALCFGTEAIRKIENDTTHYPIEYPKCHCQ